MPRRRDFLIASTGLLLPVAARAQTQFGVVHDVSGDVALNGFAVARNSAIQIGQTISTGADGRVWFSLAGDAYFLRPNSRLRLDTSRPGEPLVDFLRLVTGAIGATFARGMRRSLVTATSTIGIRGTGVYIEASPDATYVCTCFGVTEILTAPDGRMMETVAVATDNHLARQISRDAGAGGLRIGAAPFINHTNAEMARLEALVGRPNPFRP